MRVQKMGDKIGFIYLNSRFYFLVITPVEEKKSSLGPWAHCTLQERMSAKNCELTPLSRA